MCINQESPPRAVFHRHRHFCTNRMANRQKQTNEDPAVLPGCILEIHISTTQHTLPQFMVKRIIWYNTDRTPRRLQSTCPSCDRELSLRMYIRPSENQPASHVSEPSEFVVEMTTAENTLPMFTVKKLKLRVIVRNMPENPAVESIEGLMSRSD